MLVTDVCVCVKPYKWLGSMIVFILFFLLYSQTFLSLIIILEADWMICDIIVLDLDFNENFMG